MGWISEQTMTILITGARGTVGSYFAELASTFSEPLELAGKTELDVTQFDDVMRLFRAQRFSAVVHLAAATDVDRCETDPDYAYRLNTLAAWNIALASAETNAEVVLVSTTQIFGGDGNEGPFTELDRPSPPNFYAKTKLGGEELVRSLVDRAYVVRTAWVMGGGATLDKKFVGKVAAKLKAGEPIRAVNDQFGSPTYARHLVIAIRELLKRKIFGVYHVTNVGVASRFDMAMEMKRALNSRSAIEAVSASMFPLPAPRPKSDASRSLALPARGLGELMPRWQDALVEYLGAWL